MDCILGVPNTVRSALEPVKVLYRTFSSKSVPLFAYFYFQYFAILNKLLKICSVVPM